MQGWTLFHLASKTATYQEWNNDSVFESLLTCKVKLSYTDAEVCTLLMLAAAVLHM